MSKLTWIIICILVATEGLIGFTNFYTHPLTSVIAFSSLALTILIIIVMAYDGADGDDDEVLFLALCKVIFCILLAVCLVIVNPDLTNICKITDPDISQTFNTRN
jgi:hypothetical protein